MNPIKFILEIIGYTLWAGFSAICGIAGIIAVFALLLLPLLAFL